MLSISNRICFDFKMNIKTVRFLSNCKDYNVDDKQATKKLSPDQRKAKLQEGPNFFQFLNATGKSKRSVKIYPEIPPYIDADSLRADGAKVYLDVYGCQMNVADTEVVLSVLEQQGYVRTLDAHEADSWLIVTCSIREGAEKKIWNKLQHIKNMKKQRKYKKDMSVGVLGCMAERLKSDLLEANGMVDIVAGPDSYKDLPRLLAVNRTTGQSAINVLLSQDETYSDLTPVRLSRDSVTAFLSIQRGCDNMCSYCIVPYTRGRERSRKINTILDEVRALSEQGVKEITLLGQNVNSYRDMSSESLSMFTPLTGISTRKDFKTVYKTKEGGLRFVDLLDQVSRINPEIRIRFTSPHPKDFPEEVLYLISERDNICNNIHLPAQCGSDKVLENMGRGYTIQTYLQLVQSIREKLGDVGLTSDFIVGFCGENEEDFQKTLQLLETVKYNKCFLFPYSMREKTGAHRKLEDDVPQSIKIARLEQIKDLYRKLVLEVNESKIGSIQKVLVTGDSKRSKLDFQGTCELGTKVIFSKHEIADNSKVNIGDYVNVRITSASSEVLKGTGLQVTTLQSSSVKKDEMAMTQ